jgi:hypothetical protein
VVPLVPNVDRNAGLSSQRRTYEAEVPGRFWDRWETGVWAPTTTRAMSGFDFAWKAREMAYWRDSWSITPDAVLRTQAIGPLIVVLQPQDAQILRGKCAAFGRPAQPVGSVVAHGGEDHASAPLRH